jgi:hypothetical protein
MPFTYFGERIMEKPLLMIAAIAGIGLVYVVFPVMLDAFMRYRKIRRVNCPEEKKTALMNVNAKVAALAAAQGKAQLRVSNCSLWPEKRGCAQRCLAQVS